MLGPLVGAGGVALVFGHEGAGEGGEFVEPALVFHAVVGGDFDLDACGDEGDEFADGDADHAEAEACAFGAGVRRRCGVRGCVAGCGGRGCGVGSCFFGDGFVVPVSGDYGVVDGAGDVVEDVQRYLRGDVELRGSWGW